MIIQISIIIIVMCILALHLIIFSKSQTINKILLANVMTSSIMIAIILVLCLRKSELYIDILFFYIILAPISAFAVFLYYKFTTSSNMQLKNSHSHEN